MITLLAALAVGLGLAFAVVSFLQRAKEHDEELATILQLPFGERDIPVEAVTESRAALLERSVALATRPVVRLDDLPVDLAIHEVGQRAGDLGSDPLPLREARDRFEQAYFLRALERENWNQSRAARSLGIHRNTLIARLTAWGIRRVDEIKDLPEAAGERS